MSHWFSKMAAIASQFYFRFLVWPCPTLTKAQNYWRTKFQLYLNPRPRYYYFRFLETNGRHIEILLPASILTFSQSSACDSALPTKFYANWMIADGVMTSYWFYKMSDIASQIYYRFLIGRVLHLRRFKAIGTQNFEKISQSTAEDRGIIVIGMWYSIPNFVGIGSSAAELSRHSDFQDGGHSVANLLPVCGLATSEI